MIETRIGTNVTLNMPKSVVGVIRGIAGEGRARETTQRKVWRAREKGERQNRAKYRKRGRRERDRIERSIESEEEGSDKSMSDLAN